MSHADPLQESGFLALLEAAPDAMVISDGRGRIVRVNAQAERLFGYTRNEMIGREIELLVPHRYRPAHVGHRDAYLRNAKTRPMGANLELYALRSDGSEFPVEISLSPLSSDSSRLVVSAIRDITDRRAVEAERNRLIQERAAHAEANRVKDEFLATLSHELRTPLNAILGWAALARTRPMDPEVERALSTIERNARMQVQLIEDLLDVSRVLAGKLRLDMAALDLAEVCDSAVEVIRPAAQAKGIQLNVVYESKPLLMVGDADRLQQVIWNLLSNAVKFTERGGRVDLTARHTEEGTIRLLVRDTGRGISAEFLPHVFDRFRQADSSSTRQFGGLGLGLSIARSLIESHGGSIEVASSGAGRGAAFAVTLPARSAPARTVADAAVVDAQTLGGLRLLVVDDQPDERELLAEILTRHGAIVRTASSGSEALEIAPGFDPHVLMTDIAMPGEDGHVLMRRIRDLPGRIGRVPAIAVTAHARAEDRYQAFAAGFQDYVAKPVDIGRLVRRVARLARLPARVGGE
ncbi:MAG: response regulator [Acidobacteria bacterium]|nr:response regulator [Acidobacteriota bacterium]